MRQNPFPNLKSVQSLGRENAVGRNFNSRRIRLTILLVIVAAFLAAVASTASAHTDTAAAPGQPATKAQWAKLVAQAKKEGTVTIYSSQNPITLAVLADNFKKLYGISVTIQAIGPTPLPPPVFWP